MTLARICNLWSALVKYGRFGTRRVPAAASLIALCLMQQPAHAGMPSPELVLTELGKRRLEEISFFLVGFLLLTAVVRWLWNGLCREIPSLPRLSYRGTLGLMLLWGLALTVVLSLISGARELMTPAAWEPNGVTHKLAAAQTTTPVDEQLSQRTDRLSEVKSALWDHAARHDGRFPDSMDELPESVRIADAASQLNYFLTPGLRRSSPASVLLREPDISARRLLLMTDGTVVIEERSAKANP